MLFYGTKIPTTKHEIMLHAMSLESGSRTSTNCMRSRMLTAWHELDLMRQSGNGAASSCVC